LVNLDPDNLPLPINGQPRYQHLPTGARPWREIWSAGQGMDLIHDVPSVAQLVMRLRREYVAACATPHMAETAQIPEEDNAHIPGDSAGTAQ
jgi:nitronate monooxygenase